MKYVRFVLLVLTLLKKTNQTASNVLMATRQINLEEYLQHSVQVQQKFPLRVFFALLVRGQFDDEQ